MIVIAGSKYREGISMIHLAMRFRHRHKAKKEGIIGSESVGKTAKSYRSVNGCMIEHYGWLTIWPVLFEQLY